MSTVSTSISIDWTKQYYRHWQLFCELFFNVALARTLTMVFELESPTELKKAIIALLFVNKSISSFSVSFHVVAMFRVSPFWVKTAAISSVKLTNLALGEPGTHDKQHIRQGYCTLCTRTSQVNVEWNCRFRTHHHLGHPAGDPRCLCSFGWKSQSSRILRIMHFGSQHKSEDLWNQRLDTFLFYDALAPHFDEVLCT